jgi:hypothetical protein
MLVATKREQVMKHRDGILAGLGLALSVTLMAGLVGTDVYAHAAGAEAAGYQALFHVVAGGECDIPLQQDAKAGATVVAVNEVQA